jgi:osmotically-inducible protein OsmY
MTTHTARARRLAILASIVAASLSLSACAPLIVGGAAATTALIATDRRTLGEQVSDKEINLKVSNEMSLNFGQTARINGSSYNGVVLLTGDAFSEKIRGEAATIVAGIPQVKSVINRLSVGPLASFSQITSDTWLYSKVRTTLLTTKDVPSGAVVITVERGDVYLQGLVTQTEADRISAAVSGLSGVKEVFKLFEIMTPEQAAALRSSQQPVSTLPETNPTPIGMSPVGTFGTRADTGNAATRATTAPPTPAPGQPSVAPVMAPDAPQARPL